MTLNSIFSPLAGVIFLFLLAGCQTAPESLQGTGDLGVIVERATGSLALANTSQQQIVDQVEGLGDLSHASVKFSRDARYAFVFGRDGGLSKVDLLTGEITARILQSGNSIGGAISQDGQLVAVANYEPGGVKLFSSDNLELVADIPATWTDENGDQQRSKVVGLVDAPGNRFVYSLFDAGEIHVVDMNGATPELTRFTDVGKNPYDALIDPSGRYYIAGLFGEDGLTLLDLWHTEAGVQHILTDYGRGEERLPVYKMPHLEGWAMAGDEAWLPAVGRHEILIANKEDWALTGRIPVQGQPIFVMSRPDQHQVWVSFAHPDNDVVQVIDTETRAIVTTLSPGKAVLHMEFTPRGEHVWISARDSNRVTVYDTHTLQEVKRLESESPSGIFFTDRAHRIGL
ncbi:cytochrome D1 domain-containing protein [Halomonas alkaliantarctica]|uniref:Cytochrome D1 domain-containing protein n=1 Tax=Halomonas alkaliantarctica TaxID=232346 RepID=A0ABY8LRV5_9GAMM|nr:cytochrome D1 domain-containing protein [Halomonas alkaliantarctica]WGI27151.1 cytochrome D1 domain-containing protein [Halomonas alkaliantarctica]